MKSNVDPYRVLGVAPDAPDFVVQAAYRACLKRFHPDHYKGEDATEKTADVIAAYRILSDADARAAFDASRAGEAKRATDSGASGSGKPPNNGNDGSSKSPPDAESPSELPSASEDRSKSASIFVGLAVIAIVVWLFGQLFDREFTPEPVAESVVAARDLLDPYGHHDAAEIAASEAAEAAGEAADAAAKAALETVEAMGPTGGISSSLLGAEPALEYANIEAAARRYWRTQKASGISGARNFSENCHARQKPRPTWEGLDFCAAFDFAAAELDRQFTSEMGLPRSAYFAFQIDNQSSYYVGRSYTVNTRLQNIRRAAIQALGDVAAIEPIEDTTSTRNEPSDQGLTPAELRELANQSTGQGASR